MKVLTLGAGAIGGYFSTILARAGHDVTVLARGSTLEALRRDGLTIRGGPDAGHATVEAVEAVDAVDPVDLVILATKTYDTASICAAANPAISDHTVVLPLQNGVDRAEVLRDLLPTGVVLGGTVFMEAVRTDAAEITYLGGPRRIMMGGHTPETRAAATRIGAILDDAGVNVTVADDIDDELWRKFVLVCAGNALTSLTRSSLGQILADDDGRRLVGDVMREAVAVAFELGIDLGADFVSTGTEYLVGMGEDARSSMLADVEAGRQTEIDALNGHVVDRARDHGVRVPLNRVITLALRLHNRRVDA